VSQREGGFIDSTALAGLQHTSNLTLGWGVVFLDYDLDGWKDALVVNGHIYPRITLYQPTIGYAERPLLYRNLGDGTYEEVGASMGKAFSPIVGRGGAWCDYDHDGDLDFAISANGGAPRLLRNEGGSRNHWITFILKGTRSNRQAIGATVSVTAGGVTQRQMVRTGSSYASQSSLAATFGLGQVTQIDSVSIRWPSGVTQSASASGVDRRVEITEGATR
jgi:hypothetical protein